MHGFSLLFLLLQGTIGQDLVTISNQDQDNSKTAKAACCVGPNIKSCQMVTLHASVLGKKKISLPGEIKVSFQNHINGDPNSYNYVDDKGSEVIIHYNPKTGSMQGNALTFDGKSFEIENCGKHKHVFKEMDISKLDDDEGYTKDEIGEQLSTSEDKEETSDTTTVVTYSVQIYYTKEFAASTADIQTFTDALIDTTNQGYKNSNVPIRIKKHCIEQVSVADGMSSSITLNALQKLKPTLAEVRNSADVAVLYVKTFNTPYACGRARLFAVDSGSSQFGQTISVVAKSCAVTYYSFAHEIGHNVGLYHDQRTSVNPRYTFGQGHHITKGKASTGFRTVLAYSLAGHRTRVNYYSNPLVKHPVTGTPTGIAGRADNARLLIQQRFKLAAMGDESNTCGGGGGSGCKMIKTPGKYHYRTANVQSLPKSSLSVCEQKCKENQLCDCWHIRTPDNTCFIGKGRFGNPISNSRVSGGYKIGSCSATTKSCKTGATKWSCCTSTKQCDVGEGDCDIDRDCKAGLKCGKDNCKSSNPLASPTADCCVKASSGTCKTGATKWSCCTSTKQCDVGEGDCDTDRDCKAGLKCGKDNCKSSNPLASPTADCCVKASSGTCKTGATKWSCCTSTKQCDVGEGDCDADRDCKAGLKCGKDNCKSSNPLASPTADCCVKAPSGNCKTGATNWSCCTSTKRCNIGEGDCDTDIDCKAGLKCGKDNCKSSNSLASPTADCCVKASSGTCKTGATKWSCCTSTKQCDVGEGDCDTDRDCKAGLKCGKDNCKSSNPLASPTADCCVKV